MTWLIRNTKGFILLGLLSVVMSRHVKETFLSVKTKSSWVGERVEV